MKDGTYDVSIEKVLGKYQTKLRINDQRFSIGDPYPDRESAEWMANMIGQAMKNYTTKIQY